MLQGDFFLTIHPAKLEGAPAVGRWDKGHGASSNLAGNGLKSSLSGCFLRSLGMRGTVVGSEGTQRLGFSPSLWKLVPGRISQVMEKEEGTLDEEGGG